jgi:hypothetical protein
MRAFIVRPFGKKQTLSKREIDFDQVEEVLIRPALSKAEITGGTTAEFLQAGNIRADMFEQLLKADLVVADLSIHHANVFYELGIRHALRDKRTVLLRCSGDEIPFDLKTDRYLAYDADDPAASLDALALALKTTRDDPGVDSPVFVMLPSLKPQDWTQYLIVPADFTGEVDRAGQDGRADDLEMLAAETEGFAWQVEGLRKGGSCSP